MTWPYLLAAERARRELSEAAQARYADALLAIVGQSWCDPAEAWPCCPGCASLNIENGVHFDDCPWLIAARALGVQP